MRSRWLMMRGPDGSVWITANTYTLDEVLKRRKSIPVAPLTEDQALDFDLTRELRRGIVRGTFPPNPSL